MSVAQSADTPTIIIVYEHRTMCKFLAESSSGKLNAILFQLVDELCCFCSVFHKVATHMPHASIADDVEETEEYEHSPHVLTSRDEHA